MINIEKIEVKLQEVALFVNIMVSLGFEILSLYNLFQIVNWLHKDYVYDTMLNYGVQYDNTWIYDKMHHEINQFCSSHSLQQVYIDIFDQVWILKKTNPLKP